MEAVNEILKPFYDQLKFHHDTYTLPIYAMTISKPGAIFKVVGKEPVLKKAVDSFNEFVEAISHGTESLYMRKNTSAKYCLWLNVLRCDSKD